MAAGRRRHQGAAFALGRVSVLKEDPEMNGRVMTTMLLVVAALAAFAPGAIAQQDLAIPSAGDIQAAAVGRVGVEPGLNQFGTNWSFEVIPLSAFTPKSSSGTFDINEGYRFATTAGSYWYAYIDLPPGTEINQVCLFAYDNSAVDKMEFAWRILMYGDASAPAGSVSLASAATSAAATPGYTIICANYGIPVPVSAYGDADGDGDSEYNKHYVAVFPPNNADVRWGGLVVQWRRTMSPAPAFATFPNDVPTSHPFFSYVEALYASGITAGCGSGYCPDDPVTRGQMAVFLTKALGLYWPY
jgi:hypothetical protein